MFVGEVRDGDAAVGRELDVVGRQEVMLGGHEGFEEMRPRLECATPCR